MVDLPFEVLQQIFEQLDPFKIAKYRRVCRSFNKVLANPPFSNLVGLVHIGQTYKDEELFCFAAPAYFGEDFLTKVQAHAEYSFGAFKKSHANTLIAVPINPITATSAASLFEWFPLEVIGRKTFHFTGPLPNSIGSLLQLTSLDFGGQFHLLPRTSGSMTSLTLVNLMGNTVVGPIPSELGNLINLKNLNLSYTHFDGTIPDSFGNLVLLEVLDISHTRVTGPIPASFGNLVNLIELSLHDNELSGKVPDMFGGMTNLQILMLRNNYLEGPIPVSIDQCTQLIALEFQRNSFSGVVPQSIFQLPSPCSWNDSRSAIIAVSPPTSNASAQLLGTEDTHLISTDSDRITGSATASPSASLDFQSLNVASNQIAKDGVALFMSDPDVYQIQPSERLIHYGKSFLNLRQMFRHEYSINRPLPTGIGESPYLRVLSLGSNQFSGVIPESISHLVTLERLDLSHNLLAGGIPESITSLVTLTSLTLQHNKLGDQLPRELGLLTSLKILILSHNRIHGEIPESFENLAQLQLLGLSHNRLTGKIPAGIFMLSDLMHLSLDNNSLVGALPPDLGAWAQLRMLDLSHNQLTGCVPESILRLRLTSLKLNHNQLSGPLPFTGSHSRDMEYPNLQHALVPGPISPFTLFGVLTDMNLSNNCFNGTLSCSFEDMERIKTLDLSNNQFSGLVPDSLADCSRLELLDLSGNQFEGDLPERFREQFADEPVMPFRWKAR